MTTTMNVRKSEVFRVHQQLFQIPFQLRDWLSQVCKTIFLCNLQLSPVKWMNMRLWSVLSFHFPPSPPLPFSPLQCRISPPSCLFTCLDRASPILSNVCSPNCKPWSCSFLQHYQNILLLKYLNYQAYVNEFIIHQDQHFFSICSLQRLCWDYGCEKLLIVYGVFSINHLQKNIPSWDCKALFIILIHLILLIFSSRNKKATNCVCRWVDGKKVSCSFFVNFFVLSFFCSVNFSSFPRSLIFEWGRWRQEQPTGRTKKILLFCKFPTFRWFVSVFQIKPGPGRLYVWLGR